jgi:YHS domain-containing protein
MPWPGEDRDDVGGVVPPSGGEEVPHGKGQKPVKLEKEKYPDVNIDGTPGFGPGTGPGLNGLNIEGTGETNIPFNVPQVPSGLDPGIPSGEIPSGEIPFNPDPEGGISPDILPAEPFSIEGTEEEKDKKKPENTPLPSDSGLNEQKAPLPTTPTIELKDAPMPKASSLIVQEGTIEPLPPTTEESSTPAYTPAPMPSVRPSSYVPTRRQPAPIYNDPSPVPTQNVTPAPIYNETPAPVHNNPVPSDQWRSRRTQVEASAPMPETQVPAEGRHVQYQQSQEAPMPEAIPTTVAEPSQPLALEGYCPVELVLNERWVQGNAQWTASHKGRSYKFSSREAFDTFCRNPELYAPYYAGIDPIVALAGGGMMDGRTDLCAVYRGRLYMFSNQESLNQFRANPAECIEAFNTHLKTK